MKKNLLPLLLVLAMLLSLMVGCGGEVAQSTASEAPASAEEAPAPEPETCLLYTSDAADEL